MKQLILSSLLIAFALSSPATAALKFSDPLPANAFVELAKAVNPAVVNISTSYLPKRQLRRQGGQGRDPFFDMLEQFYGMQGQPQVQQQPQTALGTGFVIREDGLIVTNNHVIAGADKVQVQFDEKGKQFDAKVIGSDDRTDIALLKIQGKGFPTVALGNSKEMEVGEWVAAFGNPFGNGHTVTKGIISAKGRDIGEINKFPLLQTDAPINPGNSGGPLVNLKGQVIGVNSAIDARAQGIGFAIPIDEVKGILPQLEKNGRIRKGFLGAGLADLNPQAAQALGMENASGAVIAEIANGGPADKAGVKPYDIVTDFNGRKIEDSSQLRDAVGDAEIGKDATMKVIRDGKKKTLTVKIDERPDLAKIPAMSPPKRSSGLQAPDDYGFAITDANSEVRKEFDLPSDVKRPVITDVLPGTVAARSGLLPGDVILDVNRKDVAKAQDVLNQLKKGTNTLRVSRQGSVLFLLLK